MSRGDRKRCCQILSPIQTTSGRCYFLIAKDKVKQSTNGENAGLKFFLQTYPGDEPGEKFLGLLLKAKYIYNICSLF